jgi:hypothetical protein
MSEHNDRSGKPPEHPLIAGYEHEVDFLDVPALVDLPQPPATPRKTYCESCGHVDSHATGCPAAAAASMVAEDELEEQAEAATAAALDPEPLTPLIRRIGTSLLLRVARFVSPR